MTGRPDQGTITIVNPPRAEIARRLLVAGLILFLVGAVAACGGGPVEPTDIVSDTDRARAAVLSADPILVGSLAPPEVRPGRVRTAKLGWDRTEVKARLFAHHAPTAGAGPKAGVVETWVAETVGKLRSGGWTVHWTLCLPPPEVQSPGQSPGPQAGNVGALRTDSWYWFASAYRIDAGVSYWSLLSAVLTNTGDAWVDIVLRAPQASDPPDLFPDRPKNLPAGGTCTEDGKDATKVEQAGTLAMIREWWAFPAHTRSPDPERR